MSDVDHDLQIEMATDIKWIRRKLEDQCERSETLELRVGGIELWQAEMIGYEIPLRLDSHNKRIKATENTSWMARGVVALLVLILTLVSAGRWIDFFW